MLKKFFSVLLGLALVIAPMSGILKAQAAVSDWQKGISFYSISADAFTSDNFKQTLKNAQALGTTHVILVFPYYQSNIFSTDLAPGWNTPSDQTLASAIDYIHSLGMKVVLKPHAESYGGEWRAMINPSDRTGWFRNYGNIVTRVAQIGQAHGAEVLVIGTELVSMSNRNNPTNTQNWQALISRVRGVYSGQLTYSANSNNNNDDMFSNEKKFIDFWPQLDFIGLSAYYSLNTSGGVNELKGAWDYWNQSDIKGLAQSVGKPVLFTEIGYRSIDGARYAPWDWGRGGSPNMQEQADDYQAFLSYWNDQSYVKGVYFWDWQIDPNAGGSGDNGYTTQNKTAQGVIKQWFGSAPPPSDSGGSGGSSQTGSAAFSAAATADPSAPANGQSVTATVTLSNSGGAVNNTIVDIEVYDENNNRVAQNFAEGQSFTAKGSNSYNITWTAASADKRVYRVTAGVFTAGWGSNLYWNSEVVKVLPQTGSGSTTTPPPPPGGGTPATAITNIWWPTSGTNISGTQPFKAMLENVPIQNYRMFWQVDGDQLNPMYDSNQDYPHKEAWVDVSGWNWKSSRQFDITFISKNDAGSVISQKTATITAQ